MSQLQTPFRRLPPQLAARANKVQEQFAGALGADDFMQRVEMALHAFGFNGDNSIGECLRRRCVWHAALSG